MTKPHNPWEEFLNNCATGDNHFRSSEYQELIDFIDGIQAENAALRQESVALKEQVVQLQADLAYSNLRVTALKVEWNKAYDIGVSVKHELSTLQSKSAALVDALKKSRIGLVQWHVPENRYSAIKAIDAALAVFKGE